MTTSGPERFRQAALMLHALSRRDQAWLLRRLMPATRAGLKALLGQLRQLGIAPGLQSIGTALPPAQERVSLDAADVALVDAASAELVAAVLARQHGQVQAALLNLHPWRWRAAYWEALSAVQRSRMTELSAALPVVRAGMENALLHAFAQALEDVGAGTHADALSKTGELIKPGMAAGAYR